MKPIRAATVSLSTFEFGDLVVRDGSIAWRPRFGLEDFGHQLSPIHFLSLSPGQEWHCDWLHGLPGLFSDSLPDGWGRKLRERCCGKASHPELILDWLGALGPSAVGALHYSGEADDQGAPLIAYPTQRLSQACSLLERPEMLGVEDPTAQSAVFRFGMPVGGVHPKVCTLLPSGLPSGVVACSELLLGHEGPELVPTIVKFERHPEECEGSVEFAFSLLAARAGIAVPRSWLLNDGARHHFASQRFDRVVDTTSKTQRIHSHTLSGLLQKPAAGCAIDYVEFIQAARVLCGDSGALEVFRRACFNLIATNRDDHGRNHAFLYDTILKRWSLSPAYDLTPNVVNVLIGLAWNGRRTVPQSPQEVLSLATAAQIPEIHAREIFGQVLDTVLGDWPEVARSAGVSVEMTRLWHAEMLRQSQGMRSGR